MIKKTSTLLATLIITSQVYATASWAQNRLQKLTLEQKIGQLFVAAAVSQIDGNEQFIATSPYKMDQGHIEQLITNYHVGGIIYLGTGYAATQVALTERYQSLALTPLLIAQDFEWGLTMRLKDGMEFPRNKMLATLDNESLIYHMGYEIGLQCKALGVHMNLAPVVDVNNNPNNPVINTRSFGDDKHVVASKGLLYMHGLQDAGIIACAKHFPGHGDTDVDSHYDLPRIAHPIERLHNLELYPFKQLIADGVMSVMIAHLEVPAIETQPQLPSSLSYNVVTQLLQKDLGFDGLIITDGLGMQGAMKHYQPGDIELRAFLAGNDILLCPLDVPKAVSLIKQAIELGTVTMQELDRRVLKILQAKEWAIINQPKRPPFCIEQFSRPEAVQLQKTIYANIK